MNPTEPPQNRDTTPTRREFLQRAGIGAVALLGLRFTSGCEDIDFDNKVAGQPIDFLTRADDGVWYFQSGNGDSKAQAPSISRDDWKLTIQDATQDIAEIAWDDLAALREDEIIYWKTMRCVTGQAFGGPVSSYIATGLFTGVPLARVLEAVGAPAQAAKVRTFGRDGFRSNIDFARVMAPGPRALPVILAYELNGAPLSRLRGGPVRLIIPEMWGYKNVKWLDRIDVTDDDAFFGVYETELFNPDVNANATAAQQRLIDGPGQLNLGTVLSNPPGVASRVPGPDITVSGASYVGGDRVAAVEISVDGAPFEQARLDPPDEVLAGLAPQLRELAQRAAQSSDVFPWPSVWVTWSYPLRGLSRGLHTLELRAIDGSGRAQPDSADNYLEVAPRVQVSFEVT